MNPERRRKITAIYRAALELREEAREAFIAQASEGDSSVREEVWSLILHNEKADTITEDPASDLSAESQDDGPPGLSPGQIVGPYKIISRIGEGAMGVVYLAHHTRLDRRVALKLLPEHFMVSKDRVRRFEQEARAASKLDHENIITIYDIGQTERAHFIATEYVDGETLRERIARGPMDVAELVKVMEQVASALKAAHGAGIVHRDIKPDNIMIRRDGTVKVLDWGLAKLMETRTSDPDAATMFHTLPGVVVGTPNYMSPEQVAGATADERSDLFSLGAVLYECATARLAFPGENVIAVWRQIDNSEPPPPSTVNRRVPSELDHITLKALAKNPRERYQTTEELLADLRRAADGAVHAVPTHPALPARTHSDEPPASSRFLRVFSNKLGPPRPAVILTLGAVFISFVLLTTWLAWPRRPNPQAVEKYELGARALRDKLNFKATRLLEDAVKLDPEFAPAHAALATAWTELDYSELAKEANINAQATERKQSPLWRWLNRRDALYLKAVDADIRRAYAEAITHYGKLLELSPENPHAHLDLGRAYERNDDVEKALESYWRATELDPQYAAAHLRQAFLYRRKREFGKAHEAVDRAESLYDRLGDDEGVAEARYHRGMFLSTANKLQPARAELERVLGMPRANKQQQIRAMLQLSQVFCSMGQTAQAEELAKRAVAVAQDEDISNLSTQGLIDLGNSFFQRRQVKEAEEYLRQALSLAQKYKGRRNEARALLSLGSIALARSDFDAARNFVEQAIPFYSEGGYRTETLQALTILGLANNRRGNYDDALTAFRDQLRVAEQAGDPSQTAWAHHGIGRALGNLEQYPEALSNFEQYVAFNKSQSMHLNVGYGLVNRAEVLWQLGRYGEAQEALAQAASIANMPDESYKQILPIISKAKAKMMLSRRQFRESQSESRYTLGTTEDKGAHVEAKFVLGLAQALSGDARTGRRLCEEAVEIAAGIGDARLITTARLALAEAMVEGGDAPGGLSAALRVKEDCERHGQHDSGWRALLVAARASAAAGDKQKSLEYTSQARAVLSKLQHDWGTENYHSYLARPDIQLYSRQLDGLNESAP